MPSLALALTVPAAPVPHISHYAEFFFSEAYDPAIGHTFIAPSATDYTLTVAVSPLTETSFSGTQTSR